MADRNSSLPRAWLQALIFALFCYATFGKSFAYFFIGEAVLVLGILIFMLSPRFMLFFSDRTLVFFTLFAFWGICRTLPYLGKYKVDAIRDAVLWGYGGFAILIVAFVNNSQQISRALNTYRKFLRWYLPILPFLIPFILFQDKLPRIPWSPGVGIIALKFPDAAVHLSAAAIFILIFGSDRPAFGKQEISINRLLSFTGWSLSVLLVTIFSRGGLVAILIPIIVVSLLRFRQIGWKIAAYGTIVLVLSISILETDLVTFHAHGREFNADTAMANLTSIVGGQSEISDQQDTKTFRLIWWKNIIGYTVFGKYFWTGLGFGINLATDGGGPHASATDAALRSPHNGSMTVLARMGVPGLVLWAGINITFVLGLLRAYRNATRLRLQFWSNVNLWILSFWMAAFINMSFDVYIEGPQGGIWFWSIIGFGVAAMRIQRYEQAQRRVRQQQQSYELLQSA